MRPAVGSIVATWDRDSNSGIDSIGNPVGISPITRMPRLDQLAMWLKKIATMTTTKGNNRPAHFALDAGNQDCHNKPLA